MHNSQRILHSLFLPIHHKTEARVVASPCPIRGVGADARLHIAETAEVVFDFLPGCGLAHVSHFQTILHTILKTSRKEHVER